MNSTLYAILIGIDYYFPNNFENAKHSSLLKGCVNDIDSIEDMLILKMKIQPENIIKLTSSKANDSDNPSEPPEKWPTYKNIVTALKHIITIAQPGDQVYIHYSGHGGRTKTILPEIKGKDGFDKILVLVGRGNFETCYLRDIEIIKILKEMLDKKLFVTLILDSSYYGSTIRGRAGADIRSINVLDNEFHQKDSLIGSLEELASAWNVLTSQKRLTAPTKNEAINQDINLGSDWLPNPRDYVLITACKSSESAYEYIFEENQRNGVLTYWLVKTIEHLARPITYKVLHDSIVAKVHSQFPMQTPMLEGEKNREIFGSNKIQEIYEVKVIKVDLPNQKILLNAGQVHGIRKGTIFAIYPLDKDFSHIDKRLALAEVDKPESTISWAKIIKDFNKGSIKKETRAILLNHFDIAIKRKIRLVSRNQEKRASSSNNIGKKQEQALNKISSILEKNKKSEKGLLELASEYNEKADFQVAVNRKGEYEIWDPAGNIFPNLNPPLLVDNSNSADMLIKRLEHLTKYIRILLMDNPDSISSLSQKIVIELFKAPDDYDPVNEPLNLQPIESAGNTKVVKVGQKLILRIKNTLPRESKQVVNITVLDLQPDWGITQIFPMSPDASFIPIDPDHEAFFPLMADLPEGFNEGKDVIKVFSTTEQQTNFRFLELPSLDQPLLNRQYETTFKQRGSRLNRLEIYMESIIGRSVSRNNVQNIRTVETTKTIDWASAQIEIQINRVTPKSSTVFISYAQEDSEEAKKLYRDLKSFGLNPWLDIENLRPGEKWQHSIEEAIKNSEFFITLFSTNSVTKRGYVQRELKEALDVFSKFPQSKIYVIPVRLDNCEIPYEKLQSIEYADLFPNWKKGVKEIVNSIKGTANLT